MPKVLILYHTFTGKTKLLAEAVAEGARGVGAEVEMKKIGEVTLPELQAADAVILGTPQPFGFIAGETKKFFENFWRDKEKIGQKPWGVFLTYATDPGVSLRFLERQGPRYGFEKGAEWLLVKREEAEQQLDLARQMASQVISKIGVKRG